jgi:nitrile hydratase accessory protein
MPGAAALPRANGELVFEAPWQGRVFAMALAVVEERGLDWDDFRRRLIAAIEADPSRPYYESWTVALAGLVVDTGVVTEDDLDTRAV